MKSFDLIRQAVNNIYDAADCDGGDRISHMLSVIGDHVDLIERKISDVQTSAAEGVARKELEIKALKTKASHPSLALTNWCDNCRSIDTNMKVIHRDGDVISTCSLCGQTYVD